MHADGGLLFAWLLLCDPLLTRWLLSPSRSQVRTNLFISYSDRAPLSWDKVHHVGLTFRAAFPGTKKPRDSFMQDRRPRGERCAKSELLAASCH